MLERIRELDSHVVVWVRCAIELRQIVHAFLQASSMLRRNNGLLEDPSYYSPDDAETILAVEFSTALISRKIIA